MTTGPPPGAADAFEQARNALSPAQREAVEAPGPALCILAGAGAGKTRVLTLRVACRIRDGSAEADHTIVCTFTRRAADQLRGRLRGYGVPVSVPGTRGGPPTPGVRAGTIHQLALGLLRRRAVDCGQSPPAVSEHRIAVLRDLLADPAGAVAVDTEVGWAKAHCLGPDQYEEAADRAGRVSAVPPDVVVRAFRSYEGALARRASIDLDDVLVSAAELLEREAPFVEQVRWRHRHLFVDEFQDVNPAQFRLLRGVLGDRTDLCVVGDPDQAIYGWNGADPSLLSGLPASISGMEVVRLATNHRCTPQVVAAAAAALGRAASGRLRSASGDGPLPVVTEYPDESAEADGVVAQLLERAGEGHAWSEHAVLARTNDQLALVRRAAERAGIPCRDAPGPEAAAAGPRSRQPVRRDGDAVELATFHRAKGLEWPAVWIVGLEDGFVPIVYAVSPAARDEERRLLYVALTRAALEVRCSWATSRATPSGWRTERRPSPWLAAVARVSRTGSGRTVRTDAARQIAALREGLERR